MSIYLFSNNILLSWLTVSEDSHIFNQVYIKDVIEDVQTMIIFEWYINTQIMMSN